MQHEHVDYQRAPFNRQGSLAKHTCLYTHTFIISICHPSNNLSILCKYIYVYACGYAKRKFYSSAFVEPS